MLKLGAVAVAGKFLRHPFRYNLHTYTWKKYQYFSFLLIVASLLFIPAILPAQKKISDPTSLRFRQILGLDGGQHLAPRLLFVGKFEVLKQNGLKVIIISQELLNSALSSLCPKYLVFELKRTKIRMQCMERKLLKSVFYQIPEHERPA